MFYKVPQTEITEHNLNPNKKYMWTSVEAKIDWLFCLKFQTSGLLDIQYKLRLKVFNKMQRIVNIGSFKKQWLG